MLVVVVVVVSGVGVVVGMAVVGTVGGGSLGVSVGAPVRLKEGKAGGSVGLAAILGGPGKKRKCIQNNFFYAGHLSKWAKKGQYVDGNPIF